MYIYIDHGVFWSARFDTDTTSNRSGVIVTMQCKWERVNSPENGSIVFTFTWYLLKFYEQALPVFHQVYEVHFLSSYLRY